MWVKLNWYIVMKWDLFEMFCFEVFVLVLMVLMGDLEKIGLLGVYLVVLLRRWFLIDWILLFVDKVFLDKFIV